MVMMAEAPPQLRAEAEPGIFKTDTEANGYHPEEPIKIPLLPECVYSPRKRMGQFLSTKRTEGMNGLVEVVEIHTTRGVYYQHIEERVPGLERWHMADMGGWVYVKDTPKMTEYWFNQPSQGMHMHEAYPFFASVVRGAYFRTAVGMNKEAQLYLAVNKYPGPNDYLGPYSSSFRQGEF